MNARAEWRGHALASAAAPARVAVMLIAAWLLIAGADWLDAPEGPGFAAMLARQRGRGIDLSLWWGAWCLLSHRLGGQWHCLVHARIAAGAALAYGAAKLVLPLALAAVELPEPALLRPVGWMLAAAAAGWIHVGALPARQRTRRLLRAAAVAAAACGLALPVWNALEADPAPPRQAATLPRAIDLHRVGDIDGTLKDLDALRDSVDKARQRPLK